MRLLLLAVIGTALTLGMSACDGDNSTGPTPDPTPCTGHESGHQVRLQEENPGIVTGRLSAFTETPQPLCGKSMRATFTLLDPVVLSKNYYDSDIGDRVTTGDTLTVGSFIELWDRLDCWAEFPGTSHGKSESGGDPRRVSLGESVVFEADPDHKNLQLELRMIEGNTTHDGQPAFWSFQPWQRIDVDVSWEELE